MLSVLICVFTFVKIHLSHQLTTFVFYEIYTIKNIKKKNGPLQRGNRLTEQELNPNQTDPGSLGTVGRRKSLAEGEHFRQHRQPEQGGYWKPWSWEAVHRTVLLVRKGQQFPQWFPARMTALPIPNICPAGPESGHQIHCLWGQWIKNYLLSKKCWGTSLVA